MVVIIILGSLIIGCMSFSWMILMWFRYQLQQYLNDNKKEGKVSENENMNNKIKYNENHDIPVLLFDISSKNNKKK